MNKGFTLIECMIVLLCISIFSLNIDIHSYENSILNWNTKQIKSYLLLKKREALLYKKKITIHIEGNILRTDTDKKVLNSNIVCNAYTLSFNARGNVNQANTLICTYKNQSNMIKIHLGSGDIYVEE